MFIRRSRQVVIFLTAGVMIAGFVSCGYLPLQRQSKTVKQQQAARKLLVARARAAREVFRQLEVQLQQMQTSVENYDSKVPAQRRLGVFLQEIAGLMNRCGLEEQLVEPGLEVQLDGLRCIPVSMECKGTLAEIFEFYKSLDGLGRLVRIGEVRLVTDRTLNGLVRSETKVAVYYEAEAEEG